MSLVAAYILPHPPMAVPEVSRGSEGQIQRTLEGYADIASRIASIAPNDIVIISPHTAYYSDWIFMAGGNDASGSLAQFRAPEVQIHLDYDVPLRERIEELAQVANVHAGVIDKNSRELDHGMLVPLYFVDKAYPSSCYKAVSIGGSALGRHELIEFGRCIARACEETDRKCALLVSGDLSHKLKEDGPYGFDPAGPEFEQAFIDVVKGADALAFADINPVMCESAAECGLSGFIMMAGALDEASKLCGLPFTSEFISHEDITGVGYGIAAFEREDLLTIAPDGEGSQLVADDTENTKTETENEIKSTVQDFNVLNESGDLLVALAMRTINEYVRDRSIPEPTSLPEDSPKRAGCFVSIHVRSTGELRGCIGTIEPVQASLAEEIIANAISASTRDPRFDPITPNELDDLEVNVDVLFPPEPSDLESMNPKRYGIIVEQGYKRGLLLPDLEGVDTVADQFRIACMKAGIDPTDPFIQIKIQRFEVVRHK